MRLIDSHIHLDDTRFDSDRDEVINRARQAGVVAQIIPGVTASGWHKINHISAAHHDIFYAYGLHPMFMSEHKREDIEQLKIRLAKDNPVAVGECGLDFFVARPDKNGQREYFQAQIEIARDADLPLIIHARKAMDEVTSMLAKSGYHKGVVHSFSGSEQQAKRLIDLGYLISLGGPVTHERAKRLHKILISLPLDTLLLETDAPDQPGADHRGERNEPAFITEVLSTFNRLRGETAEHIAEVTTQNALNLFKLTL